MRILLVDDEPELRHQISTALREEKYLVVTAADGEEALDKIFAAPFDLLILDVMLPGKDGFTVLRELREGGVKTPVLLLTALGELEDKVQGLDLGADDYLAKPFSLAELQARIRALLRRGTENAGSCLAVGELVLDTVSREVLLAGRPVSLTPKEFALLEFLFYNKNRTVSRFDLAEHVWGEDYDPFSMSNFIDVHMKNLRRKLGDRRGERLQTVRGIGYRLVGDRQ